MVEEELSGSISDSDSEFKESRRKLSEEEVEEARNMRKQGISNYEKHRLLKITEKKNQEWKRRDFIKWPHL